MPRRTPRDTTFDSDSDEDLPLFATPPLAQPAVITVSELNRLARAALEQNLPLAWVVLTVCLLLWCCDPSHLSLQRCVST